MTMGLRVKGRAKQPIAAELVRELTAEDLALLSVERGVQAPPVIGKLRERHHALARLIAEGRKPGEAALMTRYDPSRVSILLGDPAFQDLVAHYRAMVNDEYVGFHAQLAALGVDAASLLAERMEETPDDISTGQLMQLVTLSADRTGFGPSQKTEVNVRVGLAERLAKANQRIAMSRDVTPPDDAEELA